MGLVLGAQVGDVFLIGERRVRVASIESSARIVLQRDDGRLFVVRYDRMTEVFLDVFICIGSKPGSGSRRLVFDAPSTVVISRN